MQYLKILLGALVFLATIAAALAADLSSAGGNDSRLDVSAKTSLIINFTGKNAGFPLDFKDYSREDYISFGFNYTSPVVMNKNITLQLTIFITNTDGITGDKLTGSGYRHLGFFRCIITNSTGQSNQHFIWTGFKDYDKNRKYLTIDDTIELKNAKSIMCEDPLINGTNPVVGYMALDNLNQISPDTMGWMRNNKIRNFTMVTMLESWGNMTAYENLVDVYLIGGMQSAYSTIAGLNQTKKGIVTINNDVYVYLGLCNTSKNWAGSDAIVMNTSGPVVNTSNNWVMGANTISGFKDHSSCNGSKLNLPKSFFKANNTANDIYYLAFIENNTAFYRWTNRARWAILPQQDWDNSSKDWTELSRNLTIRSLNWVLDPNEGATAPPAGSANMTCTPPAVNAKWQINLSEYCTFTWGINLGEGNISFMNSSASGNVTFANVMNASRINLSGLKKGHILYVTANTRIKAKVR